jgi:hypothetical protein
LHNRYGRNGSPSSSEPTDVRLQWNLPNVSNNHAYIAPRFACSWHVWPWIRIPSTNVRLPSICSICTPSICHTPSTAVVLARFTARFGNPNVPINNFGCSFVAHSSHEHKPPTEDRTIEYESRTSSYESRTELHAKTHVQHWNGLLWGSCNFISSFWKRVKRSSTRPDPCHNSSGHPARSERCPVDRLRVLARQGEDGISDPL